MGYSIRTAWWARYRVRAIVDHIVLFYQRQRAALPSVPDAISMDRPGRSRLPICAICRSGIKHQVPVSARLPEPQEQLLTIPTKLYIAIGCGIPQTGGNTAGPSRWSSGTAAIRPPWHPHQIVAVGENNNKWRCQPINIWTEPGIYSSCNSIVPHNGVSPYWKSDAGQKGWFSCHGKRNISIQNHMYKRI